MACSAPQCKQTFLYFGMDDGRFPTWVSFPTGVSLQTLADDGRFPALLSFQNVASSHYQQTVCLSVCLSAVC